MPVPLAMMIPFMFMQSIMMGYGFGTGFQYSKRKISAMSNEEFNKTTMRDEAQKMFLAYDKIIPDLEQSIRDSKDLQVTIVEEMVKIPAHLLNALLGTGTETSATSESPAGSQPIIPTPGKKTADIFKPTTKRQTETRKIWVITPYLKIPPTDSWVLNRAKQDLYLGSAPKMQKTLVIDKMEILRRTTSVKLNNEYKYNYEVKMDFHWFT